MNSYTRLIGALSIVVPFMMLMFSAPIAAQQNVRATLFEDANNALNAARSIQAEALGPKNFSKAIEYYRHAEKDYEKGKNLESIRQDLIACVSHCKLSVAAATVAKTTLPHAIKARSDALKADAATFAPKNWTDAEEKFIDATRDLEAGRIAGAKKRAGDAEVMFRNAELIAIKESSLRDTWALLKQADKKDVKKFAPITLTKSQQLLTEAERELNENRYDTDRARSLAKEAKYEASHSLYLAAVIKRLRDDKEMHEEQLLIAEQPLQKIADKLEISAAFDSGLSKTTFKVIESILTLQDSTAQLQQQLADARQQIDLAQSRIAELEEKLGGIEQEKSELAKAIEANNKVRAQFAAIEKLFERDEATVFRKGKEIFVRLIGLTFPVGKSIIEPQNFAVLTKMQQAIRMFPNCTVGIEGHTDSHGGDDMNFELSQQRAQAVQQYLIANMGIASSLISSTGYGETMPIASNETKDGRAKNRRIDVVINPSP